MKTFLTLCTALMVLAVSPQADAQSIWEKAKKMGKEVKQASQEAWDATSEFGAEAWQTTKDWSSAGWEKSSEWIEQGEQALNEMLEPESPAEARKNLDVMSKVALAKLFKQTPKAKELFDKSYGYAVFDSRKFSLMFHTNGGSGVAVDRHSGERIYMNMFGAGLALGVGGKFYQQVMLFLTKEDFVSFTEDAWDKGWQGTSEAGAVIGGDSAEVSMHYADGLAVFVMNDQGLLLDANLSGSKYWRDSDLN